MSFSWDFAKKFSEHTYIAEHPYKAASSKDVYEF